MLAVTSMGPCPWTWALRTSLESADFASIRSSGTVGGDAVDAPRHLVLGTEHSDDLGDPGADPCGARRPRGEPGVDLRQVQERVRQGAEPVRAPHDDGPHDATALRGRTLEVLEGRRAESTRASPTSCTSSWRCTVVVPMSRVGCGDEASPRRGTSHVSENATPTLDKLVR